MGEEEIGDDGLHPLFTYHSSNVVAPRDEGDEPPLEFMKYPPLG